MTRPDITRVDEARLVIVPVHLSDARVWVDRVHRHHRAPQGGLFAVGIAAQDADGGLHLVGVAITGRPVARHMDDGWTVEVTRVAVLEGYPNACSMLYGACWRTARALGYRRAITYTLHSEPGTSLRAAGWRCIGQAGGDSWNHPGRPRVDKHPLQAKFRWEVTHDPL